MKDYAKSIFPTLNYVFKDQRQPSETISLSAINDIYSENSNITVIQSTKDLKKRYEVLDEIDNGRFGQVYLVKSRKKNREYAMKKIKTSAKKGLKVTREIFIHFYLSGHRDFIRLISAFDYTKNDRIRIFYLIMEYSRFGPLYRLLTKDGLEIHYIRFIAASIYEALKVLRENFLIHYDLKPDNILVDVKGYLKLADFGNSEFNHGNMTTFKGTLVYAAPEVLRKQPHSYSCDYFSFGCTILVCATGRTRVSKVKRKGKKRMKELCLRRIQVPKNLDEKLKDFIIDLTTQKAFRRLGHNRIEEIREHIFLKNFNFEDFILERV